MDELDEECTTVVRIHKNFEEKFCDKKRPRLGDSQFDYKSSIESRWLKQRLESQQNDSEVISLKANISQLNMVISSLEKQKAEEKIYHKKQVDAIMCANESLKKQVDDMEHQGLKMASKYETVKDELVQLKKELQSCREQLSNQSRNSSLLAVQMELEEVKQMNTQKSRSVESENERLKNILANITEENDTIRIQLKNKSNEFRKLESDYEGAKHQLNMLNQQIKDCEHERSKDEQNMKQSKWIEERIEKCKELEEENKELKYEVSYLKSTKENLDLLNEKCRGLQEKLERSENRCGELNDLQLGYELLKKRMAEFDPLFNSIPTVKSASDVLQLVENLNHTNQMYAEANSNLKSSLHKCEDELIVTQAEVKRMRVEVTDLSSKNELISSQFKSLKQKLLLVVKERDSYKSILDAYESEMTQTLDPPAQRRFRILEENCEGFKKLCLEKDAEIQKHSELTQNFKRKIVSLEQQLVEFKHNISRNSNSDSGVVLSLQEKIVELQKKLESVCHDKDMLEHRIEISDMLGHYNPAETKVIQMKSTPYSNARENLTRDIESLKEENQLLKLRMKTMMESSSHQDLTSRTTQALASIPSFKEKEELQSQLMSSELLNKRLKEKYEQVSKSFKSMVSKLLGYKVERSDDGIYKLASIFSQASNEFLIFEESQGEVFTLMENDYLYSFRDLVELHLRGSDALPAFMSAVTLSLRERHITDSTFEQSTL